MNKLFSAFLFLVFSLGGIGCASEIDNVPDMVFENPEDSSSSPVVCQHNQQWSETQTFVDKQGRDFNMSVDYESQFDADSFSAFEVAELAALAIEVHEFMELDNPEEAYEMLRYGHWLVTGTNDMFDSIYNTTTVNPTKPAEEIGAVIFVNFWLGWPCYEVDYEDARWTSMIRATYWDRGDPSIVVHEMMHALSMATTGDSDSTHSDPTFWSKLSEDSVQARVVALYQQKYYPNR